MPIGGQLHTVAEPVPQIAQDFVGVVGGALADRYDRRKLMIWADLIRALAIGALGILSLSGTIEAMAGVEYDSCCISLRLVDRNYVNQGNFGIGPAPVGSNLNQRDNAILFEVVFK